MTEFVTHPDMATLFHVNRYIDHHPRATYIDVINWTSNWLPSHFPWVIITADIEQAIIERLCGGKAMDA